MSRAASLLLAVLATAWTGPALAQEPGDEPAGPDLEQFERAFDPSQPPPPYEELRRLLDRPAGPDAAPVGQPPRGAAPLRAVVTATVQGGVVRGQVELEVALLRSGWTVVPLGLTGAGLDSLTDGRGRPVAAGRLADLAANDPDLPHQGVGALLRGPGRVRLTAEFSAPVLREGTTSRLALGLPPATLTQLTLTLPEAGLPTEVTGALAVRELPAQGATTRLEAYFAAGATARVAWTPRARPRAGGEAAAPPATPHLQATTATAFTLGEGVLHTAVRIDYRILQAPCDTFEIRIPGDATLRAVEGAGVTRLPATTVIGEHQVVTVRLPRPVRDAYTLTIRTETVLDVGATALEAPEVLPVGVDREQGVVAIRGSRERRLEPHLTDGLAQLPLRALPATLQQATGWGRGEPRPPAAFRYLRRPWSLTLRTAEVEPRVSGQVNTLAVVRDDEIGLATTVRYTIRDRGIFGLRLRVPPGFRLQEVANERDVEEARIEEDARGRVLVVDLERRIPEGTFVLGLFGSVPRPAAGEPVTITPLALEGVVREEGVLAVAAEQQLALAQTGARGLIPVSTAHLAELGFLYGPAANEELAFAYRYAVAGELAATFEVGAREPKLSAELETLVDAQEDRLRVSTTIHLDVEYAGIDQVRVAVPETLAEGDALTFAREGVVDRRVEATDDGPVVVVTLQGKRTGRVTLRCAYTIDLDDFAAGDERVVVVRPLHVLGCAAHAETIAVKKHENLAIATELLDHVEARDLSGGVEELPEELAQPGVLSAFRVADFPASLGLRVAKYDLRSPAGLVVHHVHEDVVVKTEGGIEVEATLSVESDGQNQSLHVALPAGAEVRGHGVKVQGRKGTLTEAPRPFQGRPVVIVHLGDVGAGRGEPFQVRIRYRLARPDLGALGSVAIAPLTFPTGNEDDAATVPIGRGTRALYLPKGYRWLAFQTAATRHFAEGGLWDGLFAARDWQGSRYQGARETADAIAELKGLAPQARVGMYPELSLPRGVRALLLEDPTGDGGELTIPYAGRLTFTFLCALLLLGAAGLSLVVERRAGAHPAAITAAGAAGLLVLGYLAGKPLAVFLAAGVVGSLGYGVIACLRAIVHELTAGRAARREEAETQTAKVTRARARATEAEALLQAAAAGEETPS